MTDSLYTVHVLYGRYDRYICVLKFTTSQIYKSNVKQLNKIVLLKFTQCFTLNNFNFNIQR